MNILSYVRNGKGFSSHDLQPSVFNGNTRAIKALMKKKLGLVGGNVEDKKRKETAQNCRKSGHGTV